MDTRILREFLVLAQTENYLEAAEILFISQPTLSRHIMTLENEIGVPLFDRTTRSVKLNKYGRLLMPYAQKFIQLLNQFDNMLLVEKRSENNALNICFMPAMSSYKIIDVLLRFKDRHPEYDINVIPAYRGGISSKLRAHECQFAFLRETTMDSNDELIRLPYTTDKLIALVPKTHELAKHDSIALSTLSEYNLVTFSDDTFVYNIIRNACLKCGFEPRVAYTDYKAAHLLDSIMLGNGVGLLFDKMIPAHAHEMDTLKIIDVTPTFTTNISLAYLAKEPQNQMGQDFLDIYNEYMVEGGPDNH